MTRATLTEIELTDFRDSDIDFIYKLKCEESSIFWGGFSEKPNRDKLKHHYLERSYDRTKKTLIIWWAGTRVGVVSFKITDGALCEDFSINISENFSGLGIGRIALNKTLMSLVADFPRCKKVISWISQENLRSQFIFKEVGFKKMEIQEVRRMDSQAGDSYFDRWDVNLGVWEVVFKNQVWGKYPGEDLIRFIARNFYSAPDRQKIKILEIGCGPGANLWYLAREGFSFVGIDSSPTAIEQAAERLDEEFPNWREHSELAVGDVGDLPYLDEQFDAVIDNECVYCNGFEESRRIYREVFRVLRKGAPIFVRTFAVGSWGDGTGVSIGENTWICNEGPLANKGLSRFTSIDQVPILLEHFEVGEVELVSRSVNDRKKMILEWVINARKVLK